MTGLVYSRWVGWVALGILEDYRVLCLCIYNSSSTRPVHSKILSEIVKFPKERCILKFSLVAKWSIICLNLPFKIAQHSHSHWRLYFSTWFLKYSVFRNLTWLISRFTHIMLFCRWCWRSSCFQTNRTATEKTVIFNDYKRNHHILGIIIPLYYKFTIATRLPIKWGVFSVLFLVSE